MLAIREQYEELERRILSPYACLAAESKGRETPEEKDPIRTDFQRDRDRIIHCKAFRRLKHKTQVFIDPEEDHYRTRLTHTLEVSQIARTISRALRLNEDLTEAIALGHDLGHTPFGHIGEQALDEVMREFEPDAHFHHAEQSLRVVDHLEKDGRGLNLTWEVRNGIQHHSKGMDDLGVDLRGPATLEGKVVRIADRIAYINHDIDDAIRAGIISDADLPEDCARIVGRSHSARISSMVTDIITASLSTLGPGLQPGPGSISISDPHRRAMNGLKDFLFQRVYGVDHPGMAELREAGEMLKALFRHYMASAECSGILRTQHSALRTQGVCDFIAGMTDRYAQKAYAAIIRR